MVLTLTLTTAVTLLDKRSQSEKQMPSRWKVIMLNCVIIWHACLVNRVVSQVVRMLINALLNYFSILSIIGSFTNKNILTTHPR